MEFASSGGIRSAEHQAGQFHPFAHPGPEASGTIQIPSRLASRPAEFTKLAFFRCFLKRGQVPLSQCLRRRANPGNSQPQAPHSNGLRPEVLSITVTPRCDKTSHGTPHQPPVVDVVALFVKCTEPPRAYKDIRHLERDSMDQISDPQNSFADWIKAAVPNLSPTFGATTW